MCVAFYLTLTFSLSRHYIYICTQCPLTHSQFADARALFVTYAFNNQTANWPSSVRHNVAAASRRVYSRVNRVVTTVMTIMTMLLLLLTMGHGGGARVRVRVGVRAAAAAAVAMRTVPNGARKDGALAGCFCCCVRGLPDVVDRGGGVVEAGLCAGGDGGGFVDSIWGFHDCWSEIWVEKTGSERARFYETMLAILICT